MNFEDKLKELECLVQGMESGTMKLDEMITAFEKGRALAVECRKDLASIKTRIEKVTSGGASESVAVDSSGDVAL